MTEYPNEPHNENSEQPWVPTPIPQYNYYATQQASHNEYPGNKTLDFIIGFFGVLLGAVGIIVLTFAVPYLGAVVAIASLISMIWAIVHFFRVSRHLISIGMIVAVVVFIFLLPLLLFGACLYAISHHS